MTAPETAAARFLLCCLLGCALGLVWGFLQPIRRRFPRLGDVLTVCAAVWLWLEMGFRVCRGDLRMGYFWGLFSTCLAWELTAGRWLRPVFARFWHQIGVFSRFLLLPFKNFSILQKFCLHLWKNGVQ